MTGLSVGIKILSELIEQVRFTLLIVQKREWGNNSVSSLAFDRAASYYGRTRGKPEFVSRAITDSLIDLARLTPASRVLEIGIGTGRIALPLLSRGLRVVGIDLSLAMMERVRDQIAPGARVRLAQTDANALPFPDTTFDCAYAVSVYHVVANWQNALREAWRVVKPAGYFLVSYGYVDQRAPYGVLHRQLAELAREYGITPLTPGAQSQEEIRIELEQLGDARVVEVVRWNDSVQPARVLDGLAARMVSETWLIPDDAFTQIVPRLRSFVQATIGDLTREVMQEERFEWIVINKRC